MAKGPIPKRILKVREIAKYDFWDVAPGAIIDARRTLRKWVTDPAVSDELRGGDAELLGRLDAHWTKRRRPTFKLYTREQAVAEAVVARRGQTLH